MTQTLITGASSGIGLATARCLLEQGHKVNGIARHFDKQSQNDSTKGLVEIGLDLSDLDQLAIDLKQQPHFQQDLDCLILNAGYGRFGGLEQFSHQQIRHLIDTNLISNLFLIKHYLPKFKQQGGKDIVLIGSESALTGAKQGAVYCASKFALRGLAQSLRADCANADIRVILVNPGPVDSEFFDELHFKPLDGDDYALHAQTVANTIRHALEQPRNAVLDEINIQPIKRAFEKR